MIISICDTSIRGRKVATGNKVRVPIERCCSSLNDRTTPEQGPMYNWGIMHEQEMVHEHEIVPKQEMIYERR